MYRLSARKQLLMDNACLSFRLGRSQMEHLSFPIEDPGLNTGTAMLFDVAVHHIGKPHGIIVGKRHMVDHDSVRTEYFPNDLLPVGIVIENRIHKDGIHSHTLQSIFEILRNIIGIAGKKQVLPGKRQQEAVIRNIGKLRAHMPRTDRGNEQAVGRHDPFHLSRFQPKSPVANTKFPDELEQKGQIQGPVALIGKKQPLYRLETEIF